MTVAPAERAIVPVPPRPGHPRGAGGRLLQIWVACQGGLVHDVTGTAEVPEGSLVTPDHAGGRFIRVPRQGVPADIVDWLLDHPDERAPAALARMLAEPLAPNTPELERRAARGEWTDPLVLQLVGVWRRLGVRAVASQQGAEWSPLIDAVAVMAERGEGVVPGLDLSLGRLREVAAAVRDDEGARSLLRFRARGARLALFGSLGAAADPGAVARWLRTMTPDEGAALAANPALGGQGRERLLAWGLERLGRGADLDLAGRVVQGLDDVGVRPDRSTMERLVQGVGPQSVRRRRALGRVPAVVRESDLRARLLDGVVRPRDLVAMSRWLKGSAWLGVLGRLAALPSERGGGPLAAALQGVAAGQLVGLAPMDLVPLARHPDRAVRLAVLQLSARLPRQKVGRRGR